MWPLQSHFIYLHQTTLPSVFLSAILMTWKASPHDFFLIYFHLFLCYVNTFTRFYFLYFLPKLAFSKNGCFFVISCPLCFSFFLYVIMTNNQSVFVSKLLLWFLNSCCLIGRIGFLLERERTGKIFDAIVHMKLLLLLATDPCDV